MKQGNKFVYQLEKDFKVTAVRWNLLQVPFDEYFFSLHRKLENEILLILKLIK
jgi:hypothetical protein